MKRFFIHDEIDNDCASRVVVSVNDAEVHIINESQVKPGHDFEDDCRHGAVIPLAKIDFLIAHLETIALKMERNDER